VVGPRGLHHSQHFYPGDPVLTWILGGLNFQIEHHLFPAGPAYALPADRTDRAAELREVWGRYASQSSLRAALRSHFLHLRAMGRLGLVAALEMG
jgi:linoleoyl-CoA desaturase